MDKTNRLEQRIAQRRKRRWKRRARIAAPFLAIPLLVAALVLSVGIIEYAPKPPAKKLTDQPIRTTEYKARQRLLNQGPRLGRSAVLTSPAQKSGRLASALGKAQRANAKQTGEEIVLPVTTGRSGEKIALPAAPPRFER